MSSARAAIIIRMQFRHDALAAIRAGDITVSYRRWKRPAVRAGGAYRIGPDGVVEVTSVDIADPRAISPAEARAAGAPDAASLLEALAPYDRPGTRLYRVAFRYRPQPDPRIALAAVAVLTDDEAAAIIARLDRMDAAAAGPWTRDTLALIGGRPGVLAATLAAQLGRERLPFKADIRKLKALGLTISLEVGYRLSPRGIALLERLAG